MRGREPASRSGPGQGDSGRGDRRRERLSLPGKEFDDIKLRLGSRWSFAIQGRRKRRERIGLLDERIHLSYSQERLAACGIQPSKLSDILSARDTPYAGGMLEIGGKNVAIDPSGEFHDESEIGGVIVGASSAAFR